MSLRCPSVVRLSSVLIARRGIFGRLCSEWQSLGLKSEPNTGDNGVHASASPFEALAERTNWLGATIEGDSFGRAMLAKGVPLAMIKALY